MKPIDIKHELHQSLSQLPDFSECILLDYPDNRNAGDSFIWLGNVLYLSGVAKSKIIYSSASSDFDQSILDKKIKAEHPIFLNGGGNFGDTWPRHQSFREKIIEIYPDNPIVILPQTIFFRDLDSLKRTASILNSHSNLTIFARDNVSYEIAVRYFHRCKIFKSPDTAFQLVGLLRSNATSSLKQESPQKVLYLSRDDKEKAANAFNMLGEFKGLKIEDWHSFKQKISFHDWLSYEYRDALKKLTVIDKLRVLNRILRSTRQQDFETVNYWLSYLNWQVFDSRSRGFSKCLGTSMHKRSWSFLCSGVHQLSNYDLVITDRLHGHILCTILEIPHVFLPNYYHKNEAFYETWTHTIPFCRFVENPENVRDAVIELAELYPKGCANLKS